MLTYCTLEPFIGGCRGLYGA